MIDKPVVLFSVPRSGSTWVQEYISEHNLNFGFKKIIPYEFLNEKFLTFKLNNQEYRFNNLKEKIEFLKLHNISFKIHLDQIHDVDWVNDYFKNFYKIKLIRKDYWNQFVSHSIQTYNGWNHKKEYKNTIKVELEEIDNFLNLLKTCSSTNVNYDNVFYYEDLSNIFLENFFNVKCNNTFMLTKQEVVDRRNNYSSNIKNYRELKETFYKKLRQSTLVI